MSLKYRKVYIDTRYKSEDSKSNSDFYFELDQPLVCPQGTVFYMSSISIPHSWTTIEPSLKSRLYFFIFNKTNNDNASFIVYLSDGNYIGTDLATEIKTKPPVLIMLHCLIYLMLFMILKQILYKY